jgi:hypothetical protein
MIGTDYGHQDMSVELDALRTLGERGDLDPVVAQKILDENPRALYGLLGRPWQSGGRSTCAPCCVHFIHCCFQTGRFGYTPASDTARAAVEKRVQVPGHFFQVLEQRRCLRGLASVAVPSPLARELTLMQRR